MTLAYNNKSTSGHGTDGQTDRQTECNAICGTLLRRRAPHNNGECCECNRLTARHHCLGPLFLTEQNRTELYYHKRK